MTVLDPGFETPALAAGTSEWLPSGSPWTFSWPSGIASNGSAWNPGGPNAPEGSQVLILANSGGSVSQSIPGWSATTNYTITVSAAQRYGGSWDGPTNQQNFAILVGGDKRPTVVRSRRTLGDDPQPAHH